jgi:hypothetical protein
MALARAGKIKPMPMNKQPMAVVQKTDRGAASR